MKPATLAANVGIGLAAGLAGTAAMTVSSTLEQRICGREPSLAPANTARKVLGIEKFASDAAENRFSTLVHWGYGTGWGAVRGLLRGMGLPPAAATVGHFASIWGGAIVMLPALGVAPPVTTWGAREVAIDVWHHAVYVVATVVAYERLART